MLVTTIGKVYKLKLDSKSMAKPERLYTPLKNALYQFGLLKKELTRTTLDEHDETVRDLHSEAFDAVMKEMQTLDWNDVYEAVLTSSGRLKRPVFLEAGSTLGEDLAGLLTVQHDFHYRNTESESATGIIFNGSATDEDKNLLFLPVTDAERRLPFKKDVYSETTLDDEINLLYAKNYPEHNISFYHEFVENRTISGRTNNTVEGILGELRGMESYIFGQKVNGEESWLLGRVYMRALSEAYCASLGDITQIPKDSSWWNALQDTFDLEPDEVTHFQRHIMQSEKRTQTPNYEKERQQGILIKLTLGTALAQSIGGEVYLNDNQASQREYFNDSVIVFAQPPNTLSINPGLEECKDEEL